MQTGKARVCNSINLNLNYLYGITVFNQFAPQPC